jgi:hypothetical protein
MLESILAQSLVVTNDELLSIMRFSLIDYLEAWQFSRSSGASRNQTKVVQGEDHGCLASPTEDALVIGTTNDDSLTDKKAVLNSLFIKRWGPLKTMR